MKSAAKHAEDWRADAWPANAYLIVLAVSLPLLAIELLDGLTLYGMGLPEGGQRGRFLRLVNWSATPMFAGCALAVCRYGLQGLYSAVFGLLVSLIVAFNFRSDLIRFGTLDLFESSRWIWMTPVVLGSAAGTVVGLVWSVRRPATEICRRHSLLWLMPALLAGAGLVAYRETVVDPVSAWSAFPATRHFALFAIAMCLSVLLLVANLTRRDE